MPLDCERKPMQAHEVQRQTERPQAHLNLEVILLWDIQENTPLKSKHKSVHHRYISIGNSDVWYSPLQKCIFLKIFGVLSRWYYCTTPYISGAALGHYANILFIKLGNLQSAETGDISSTENTRPDRQNQPFGPRKRKQFISATGKMLVEIRVV